MVDMQVFCFDYESGAYTGEQALDVTDCDQRSPGVMLIPGNATCTPPPRCGKGLWPVWRDGRWLVCELAPDPLADYYANL